MKTRAAGFTFIEILFMVGIGILLIVIMLPVLWAAKKKCLKTECLSNLRQIGMALQLYSEASDGLLPPWMNRRHGPNGTSSKWDNPEALRRVIQAKVGDVAILFCASDLYARRDADVFGVNHRYSSYHFNFCPPNSGAGTLTVSGLLEGGQERIPPADYELVRDANTGVTDHFDGRPARGCQHFDGVNVVYLDWHADWRSE